MFVRYKLHILGVSESRWTVSRMQTTTTAETVLYSGREDNQYHEGVAKILRKGMEESLLEWKPVSSRLMRARLTGRHTNITLIQCYPSTNDGEDTDKDAFYQQLQAEVDAVPRHDLSIVMGDLNAKVGSDNMYCNKVRGQHGCGTRNENGERLIDFCNMNNLVFGGTLCPHQDIHKLTWHPPSGRYS